MTINGDDINKPLLTKDFLLAYKRKLEKLKDYLGYGKAEIPLSETELDFRGSLAENNQLLFDITRLKLALINIKRIEGMFEAQELDTLLSFDLDYSSDKAERRPTP